MDYLFEDASPYGKEFRDMTGVEPITEEEIEIGLPASIDKKQMNYF